MGKILNFTGKVHWREDKAQYEWRQGARTVKKLRRLYMRALSDAKRYEAKAIGRENTLYGQALLWAATSNRIACAAHEPTLIAAEKHYKIGIYANKTGLY